MPTENIQSLGGKARAEALTKEQLRESARKAAEARWASRPIKAIHKGNFQKDFGIDVDCYVLDDEHKTAVMSQRGMAQTLGFTADQGNALPRFLATKKMSELVGAELEAKLAQPIKFQWGTGGAESPPTIVNGFDATLLIDLCRVIVEAEQKGALGNRKQIANQAHVILSASAKAGIKGLVYALAGYSPEVEEVIAAFKMYVQEEAKKYEKEFPNELYEQWQRLYDLKMPDRGKPWQFMHLTVNHIYFPLAKSDGKLLQLLREMKAKGGKQRNKLFQFLNEVGARALRMHMGRVLEMSESSPDKDTYEKKIEERFGDGQREFNFSPR